MEKALLLLVVLVLLQSSVEKSGVQAQPPTQAVDPTDDYYQWVKSVGEGQKPQYDFSTNGGYDPASLDLATDQKTPASPKSFIVVAQDGSGDYTTVQAAVTAVPKGNSKRVTIYVKAGTYKEKVIIPSSSSFITLKGDGPGKSIIVWGDTAGTKRGGKVLGTFNSATVAVNSEGFVAIGISFRNSAPAPAPGAVNEQAVALRLSGDKAALYNCSIYGAQDTLYLHKGRHYFYGNYIEGSIDFIFGDGRALFFKNHLHSIAKTFGSLTAQKRLDRNDAGGFSFVGCVVTGSGSIYLGRAWGPYSRVVYIYTYIADIVLPIGWNDFGFPERQKTVFYGEYKTFGPGSSTTGWPTWAKTLTRAQAAPFIGIGFIDGQTWLPSRT